MTYTTSPQIDSLITDAYAALAARHQSWEAPTEANLDDLADADFRFGRRVSAYCRSSGRNGWRRRRYLARVFAAMAVFTAPETSTDPWAAPGTRPTWPARLNAAEANLRAALAA